MFLFLLFVGLAKGEDVNFGWITPLHGTDGKCAEASQRYIEAFGVVDDLQKNMTWGPYVLDADGRLPLEGFLSDSTPIPIPLCEIFGAALPNCEQLPSFLTNVVLYVPIGFSHNSGSMELCLDDGPHVHLGVKTQYCSVKMSPPDIDTEGADPVTPGLKSHQSPSYFVKLQNLVEAVARMRKIRLLESDQDTANKTTIHGFNQFGDHMRKVQESSKAGPSFSLQQVGMLYKNI